MDCDTLEAKFLDKIINKRVNRNSPDVRKFVSKFIKMLDFVIIHPGKPYRPSGYIDPGVPAIRPNTAAARILLAMVDQSEDYFTPEEVDFYFAIIEMVEKVVTNPGRAYSKEKSLHIEQWAERAMSARAVRAFGNWSPDHTNTFSLRSVHDQAIHSIDDEVTSPPASNDVRVLPNGKGGIPGEKTQEKPTATVK
jgi:hypothetical protein